jgi:thioredoxin 1
MALQITDSNFDEMLLQKEITVVDFWAEWCGPCRMLGPVVDELAEELVDISIGKLNVSDNGVSAQKYGIVGIPCIIFFKNGEEVDRLKGVVSKSVLKQKIESLKN